LEKETVNSVRFYISFHRLMLMCTVTAIISLDFEKKKSINEGFLKNKIV